MNLGLEGKVAIVTGGTRGIGFATAKALRDEGCRVAVTGRTSPAPEPVNEWMANGGDVMLAFGDIAETGTAQRLVREVVEAFGTVDILVNNAASYSEADVLASDYAAWEQIFRTKTFGYLEMIRAVLPVMKQNGGGGVVNVSGIAALTPIAASAHAGAANAAVLNVSALLARRLAPSGVRVNVVVPGSVATERYETRLTRLTEGEGITRAEAEAQLAASIPTGRPVDPHEVALLITAMCSPRLPSLVGARVVLDGGRTL